MASGVDETIPTTHPAVERAIEASFREVSPRALATLIRLLGGDFDLAEEALQEAWTAALAAWPRSGVPANPCAWLVSTACHPALAPEGRWVLTLPTEETARVFLCL